MVFNVFFNNCPLKEEVHILLYTICLNTFHLSPITDEEMNEMVLSHVIILLCQ